ncbi:BQ2448_7691 [Microbotryum intermedium]|uniref:Mediator of RNA polymerase II transcription subunit 19 n=1 Tax=Microbotryum intermedium TaxID=269621 RepID=A0A238FLL2_9BASI|nr:BQ2448_7691 [Microbotryum intermedium]
MEPPMMEAGPSRSMGPIASTSTSTSTSTWSGAAEASTSARGLSSLLISPSNVTPSPLTGSRDLISLFHLEPLYDTHLRPYLPQDTGEQTTTTTASNPNTPNPISSNGKGKQSQQQLVDQAPPAAAARIGISFGGIKLGALGPGATTESGNEGKQSTMGQARQQKQERTYSYLVADIPGRNAIRKDSYLKHLVLNPDSPAVDLRALDEDVLRDAFTLKPGTIPGFDALVWENDTEVQGGPLNKKKKKKRQRESEAGGNVTLTAAGMTPNLSGTTNSLSEDDHRKKKKLKQG